MKFSAQHVIIIIIIIVSIVNFNFSIICVSGSTDINGY